MVDKELGDKLVEVALKQLDASQTFKAPRMARLKEYEDLYAGKLQPKLRMQFNVPLPVFSGLVDQLSADFDDPILVKFGEGHPADYESTKRIQAAWDMDSNGALPTGKWELKDRWDKKQAIMCGRGFKKYFAESDPEYKANLFTILYQYFHCEPKGGGHLENHLFCGEEAVFKTKQQLIAGARSGLYNREQVKKLIERAGSSEYKDNVEDKMREKMARFEAVGLDAENNYVGQLTYNLCEWGLTYEGKRYYLLFDPWTRCWMRAEELKEVFSSNLWQYTSWSTHEDQQLFWNKSYGDDFYPVAMSVIELLNQELTNRQKKNLGAKAYDRDMFYDVAKLDAAQYRPDALVPVRVPPGKHIQDGLFQFQTPELQGTINLINWLNGEVAKDTGVDDLNQPAIKAGGKNASVTFARLQQAQKRIGYKAHSYTENWAEIALRYVFGLDDHLGEPMAIKMLGRDGFGWDELKRSNLRLQKPLNIKITSSTEQDKQNVLGKDQKIKALEMITKDPVLVKQNNPKVLNETILRDVGGWDDDFITSVMDTQNYGNKDVMAYADMAIQQLLSGKQPKVCYGANTAFLQKILNWAQDHQEDLGQEKFTSFLDYIMSHQGIVQENMMRQAQLVKATKAQADPNQAVPSPVPAGGGGGTPIARANPVPAAPQVDLQQ